MAVDRLSMFLGGSDFTHQFGILVDDTGVVHHLREVIDVVGSHQFFNVVGIEARSSGLKIGGRHTTRRAEEELKWHFLAIFNHVSDAVLAKHIGDFVWVADSGHRAVAGRQTGKLRRHQHRTFDMHMCVDEAWHDKLRISDRLLLYLGDFAVLNDDNTRKNP